MRRLIKHILADIRRGENVDLLITIILVLVISVLNALGRASTDLVASITLATLGLIALGSLVTRYRLEDIYRAPAGSAPKFRLSRQENPEWYAYFVAQFESLWKDGAAVTWSAAEKTA